MSRTRQVAGAVLALLSAMLIPASPAAADPAGPTDYQSEIVAIEPATESIEARIIGGDSFIQLTVERGTAAEVVGYRGEPYLRFEADGVVLQNERSPSRWLNDDRYGDATVPDNADPDAPPDWITVADDGSYAWHDHRTHWMNVQKPPGATAGDTVLEAVVPLVVDGEQVAVTVTSRLLEPPSLWPLLLLGIAAAALTVWVGRRWRNVGLAVVAAAVALVALGFGVWGFRSVPAETGPSLLLWALPAVGVAVALGAVVARRTLGPTTWVLVSLAGFELVLWGWLRREAVVRALIPSDAPAGADRIVIAGALGAGLVVLLQPLVTALLIRGPRPEPRRRQ